MREGSANCKQRGRPADKTMREVRTGKKDVVRKSFTIAVVFLPFALFFPFLIS